MMNDCPDGAKRDLLPGYAHRTLSAAEQSAVAAHLESCEDCREEVALITSASRAFAVPNVDIAGIVKVLPAPPRRVAPRTFAVSARQLAAAVVILAIGAFSLVMLRVRSDNRAPEMAKASPAPVPAPGTQLAAAQPAPSSPVAIDSPAPAPAPASSVSTSRRVSISFGGGLSDLSDDQLDALMSELDGLDALPSAEPETHLTPILPPADGGHGAW